MTSRTDSRIRSTPSPARKASSSSDTTDWDNAIGGNLLVGTWRYTPRIPPMAPPLRQAHRLSKTHHSQGLSRPCICWEVGGTGDVQVEALFPQGQKRFELGSSDWNWCRGRPARLRFRRRGRCLVASRRCPNWLGFTLGTRGLLDVPSRPGALYNSCLSSAVGASGFGLRGADGVIHCAAAAFSASGPTGRARERPKKTLP